MYNPDYPDSEMEIPGPNPQLYQPILSRADAAMSSTSPLDRRLFLALATIAVVYAFLSGLRTVSEGGFFWQLATGRWVMQHHHIFSADVFSYTAYGKPWIYPVGSGLLFYAAYTLGGYALISCIGAAASCGTVALLLRRGSPISAGIAIITVPILAARTTPRAEMFTVLLFAAYLSILWQNYQTGDARLWLLPLLMIAWVNLHLGFIAGTALMVAFVGIEILEMLFPGRRRREAIQRLRQSYPWFIAGAMATLVNPWGWRIYSALISQDRAMALHSLRIGEWGSVPLNWAAAMRAFSLRDTKGTFYVLLMIATIAVLVALLQRQLGAAILLVTAAYEGVRYLRMEALTGCVVIVVGGAITFSAMQQIRQRRSNARIRWVLATSVVVMFAVLVSVRSFDLVRNHHDYSRLTFGAGLNSWFPERAVEFIERENLPGEIFNTIDEGGYLVWRFGPKHRDYIDNRTIPFGPESFQHQDELLQTSLDSALWQQEADRYNINTIILPLSRDEGQHLAALRGFCNSTNWRPVYLDESALVLVHQKPETEDLIERLQVNCATAPLPAGPLVHSSTRSFNQWANTAAVLAALGRNSEALLATQKALLTFPDSPFVPWLRGNIFQVMGLRSDSEREYLAAVSLEPSEALFWFSLATLYKHEGRIPEAIYAQRKAIRLSYTPQAREMVKLARLYLEIQQPKAALETFDEAMHSAPPDVLGESGARSFKYDVDLGRAAAWRELGDNKRAAGFDDEAVRDLYPQQ